MIFLKYSEGFGYKKKNLRFGHYIAIACCLLLIGGASWFALSGLEKDNISEESQPKSQNSEYNSNNTSYTESVVEESKPITSTEEVKNEVKNEVYESKTENKTESKSEKEIINFTMPVEGEILKDYSEKNLQYSSTYSDMRLHLGTDIACEINSPVFSVGNGTVKNIEKNTSLGTVVIIEHGNISIKYASLKDIKVKVDDTVSVGDIIGLSDTVPSECNDKSHIHIEAYKNGKQVSVLEALGLN